MNLFVSQCVTKKLFLSCSCIDTFRRCILHICLLKKQLSFSALPFVFFFFILLLLTLHVRSLLMSFYDSDRCFPFFEFIEIHFHIFHTSRENCCSLLNRCHIIFIVSFYFYLYPFFSRLKITEI